MAQEIEGEVRALVMEQNQLMPDTNDTEIVREDEEDLEST
jgi:hypothetical protein